MNPKTLYEYYTSKGQKLPSVTERTPLAQQAGITNYSGTAEQNTALLSYLMKGNQVTPIQETPPVVSSKDNAQQFQQDSTKVDNVTNGLASANQTGQKTDTTTKENIDFNTDTGKIQATGDPILDKLNQWEKEQSAKIQAESQARKAEYEALYTTSLASIDATTQATIDRINLSFDKRVKEQERINAINIGRVKAYGLSEGGRFTPIAFQDAITGREIEASDKISSLENERNSLIAQAKSARDEGASKLLREKLADLDKVDEKIRTQLQEVEKESERQYQMLRTLRKEEEEKHQAKVAKITAQLTAIAPQYIDDFEKMSEADQDKFIQQLMKSTGLDYATVYGILQTASVNEFNKNYDKTKKTLEIKEKEADLAKKPLEMEAEKALIAQRRASAAASYASAARSRSGGDKTEAEVQREATADMASQLQTVVGADGFISPSDYQVALNAWVGKGYKAEDFHKNFQNFRNPKDSGYNTPD